MGNRKENGKRSLTSSSEDPSMRAWHLAEEVEKKLIQAKAVCGVMMHMKDMDELIGEAAWAAEGLIEDAETSFKELREITREVWRDEHIEKAPKTVQS